ncbi:hypothetical protein PVAND_002375 [Polypedilum vanderplanki]|uniref:Ionotropic glutamate receptor C-terminal domain-containing protein n=1 Tax=Polypedilum vanderplanki TaxID=319348 RepID=A0A9J6BQS9_POLVA|nr:hypothetical protein PVAND_002375 [Polypedilum vanderplanki]
MKFNLFLNIFVISYVCDANDNEIKAISQAISDTIKLNLKSYEHKIEILLLDDPSNHIKDVVHLVLKKLENVPHSIHRVEVNNLKFLSTSSSVLILFSHFANLKMLNENVWLQTEFANENFRIFIYCQELTVESIGKLMTVSKVSYERAHISQYFKSIDDHFEIHGIFEDILRILSKKHNFTIYYQLIKIIDGSVIDLNAKLVDVFFINKDISTMIYKEHHVTSVIFETNRIFVVSPGCSYTTYEKLFLPYDQTTWILLLITFIIAFCIITIVNMTSLKRRASIYGHQVQHPGLNIMGTFFGISQPKLPSNFFARFILMNFILFCLIIRNAYQGVLFDMMGKDMRRPTITQISDLCEQGFDVYYPHGLRDKFDFIEGHEKMNLIELPDASYMAPIYMNQRKNDSAKSAFLVIETSLKMSNHINWPTLKERLNILQNGISFFNQNFFYFITENMIQRIIPFGIVEHSFKFHVDYLTLHDEPEKFGPQILTLKDLSYGFNIWLIAISIAILSFFGEVIIFKFKKFLRNRKKNRKLFKFAKIQPINCKNTQNKSWPKMITMRKFYLLK